MTTAAPARITALDVIRGVAVMGILVANLPAFALPEAAYFSPAAWGGSSGANQWVWLATYVLVEGKMRGLFTLLFGASMLLVTDRAAAAGDDPASVHYRRMAVLLLIGCLHLYLFWWGDILSHYALVGAIAFMFRKLPVRWLIVTAALLVALDWITAILGTLSIFASGARNTPATMAAWNDFAAGFGVPPAADLASQIAAIRGSFAEGVTWRWANATSPVGLLPAVGIETLAAMLLGMAAYRSGFLTGAWSRARYARWAAVCLGTALPAYGLLGLNTIAHHFDQRWVFLGSIGATAPLRLVGVFGDAALVMLLIRPGGWLTARVAAVGRAAFTNYLGTTLLMTFIFSGWGLGQFARWDRATLYWLVPPAWAVMLGWSAPWLARYRFGPMEWLWRSLARFALQPMRGGAHATN